MSVFDTFKGKQYKQEAEALKNELEQLKNTFTPEMRNAVKIQELIANLQNQINTLNGVITQKNNDINNLNNAISNLNNEISVRQSQIINLDEEIMLQEFGLYQPKYDFADSTIYKDQLDSIRKQQKDMIRNGSAVTGSTNWTVNGNKTQGKKMVKDMQKLLLRAFNSECDELIDKVKYNTFDAANKRMSKSCEAISKLGAIMGVAITPQYYNSKYEELCLALEYKKKKQDEKEEQKEIRARMREEAKLQKEIEEARKKIQKEQAHYSNALQKLQEQIDKATDFEKEDLLNKKAEIEQQLNEIYKSIKNIDYREANARAGYVYIISNIGSFGENVYKIGMTRRLEPMDRVDELGDASVPFNFDVHAMIFSDDAPALENALHKAFENRKLNMINTRREFFNVTLEEIESVVKANYDKTVEFTKLAPAEQYRESVKIKEKNKPITDEPDPMLEEAIKCIFETGQVSTSLLQRRLRLSYARAGRLIDTMEFMGIVGPHNGSCSRAILITYEQWLERNNTHNKR